MKGDTWGCSGTHGSVSGHAEKHGGTGVGRQQDTWGHSEMRGCGGTHGSVAGHAEKHGGAGVGKQPGHMWGHSEMWGCGGTHGLTGGACGNTGTCSNVGGQA